MRRLYYLAPSIDSAKEISRDLHQHGVSDWRFHILCKDDKGVTTHRLHAASALQRTDLVRILERGLLCGLVTGLLILFPAAYLKTFTLESWMLISGFCMLVGAWVGGIGGISNSHYVTRRFDEDIERGRYLIMVDVRKQHIPLIKELMQRHHPESVLQGASSTITNPFVSTTSPSLIKPA